MNRSGPLLTAVAIGFLLVATSCERQQTVPKDLRTLPLPQLRKLGDKGDPRAETLLGHKYFYGQGAAVDKAEGFKWYLKAAEQGYAEAQFFVGNCYGLGEGVSADQMGRSNGNAVRQTKAGPKPKPESVSTSCSATVPPTSWIWSKRTNGCTWQQREGTKSRISMLRRRLVNTSSNAGGK